MLLLLVLVGSELVDAGLEQLPPRSLHLEQLLLRCWLRLEVHEVHAALLQLATAPCAAWVLGIGSDCVPDGEACPIPDSEPDVPAPGIVGELLVPSLFAVGLRIDPEAADAVEGVPDEEMATVSEELLPDPGQDHDRSLGQQVPQDEGHARQLAPHTRSSSFWLTFGRGFARLLGLPLALCPHRLPAEVLQCGIVQGRLEEATELVGVCGSVRC